MGFGQHHEPILNGGSSFALVRPVPVGAFEVESWPLPGRGLVRVVAEGNSSKGMVWIENEVEARFRTVPWV